jgi:monoamine oxidase
LSALLPTNDEETPFHAFIAQNRYNENSAVIVAVTSGERAEKIENMHQDLVKEIFMKNLKLIFKNKEIPEPLNIYISRWGSNIFSYGSYSYYNVGN